MAFMNSDRPPPSTIQPNRVAPLRSGPPPTISDGPVRVNSSYVIGPLPPTGPQQFAPPGPHAAAFIVPDGAVVSVVVGWASSAFGALPSNGGGVPVKPVPLDKGRGPDGKACAIDAGGGLGYACPGEN